MSCVIFGTLIKFILKKINIEPKNQVSRHIVSAHFGGFYIRINTCKLLVKYIKIHYMKKFFSYNLHHPILIIVYFNTVLSIIDG